MQPSWAAWQEKELRSQPLRRKTRIPQQIFWMVSPCNRPWGVLRGECYWIWPILYPYVVAPSVTDAHDQRR